METNADEIALKRSEPDSHPALSVVLSSLDLEPLTSGWFVEQISCDC